MLLAPCFLDVLAPSAFSYLEKVIDLLLRERTLRGIRWVLSNDFPQAVKPEGSILNLPSEAFDQGALGLPLVAAWGSRLVSQSMRSWLQLVG